MSISYCETINGDQKNISEQEVIGGAKIQNRINDFIFEINIIDPIINTSNEKIDTILKNTSATNESFFMNEKTLKILISSKINLLVNPSLNCVKYVYDEMLKMFDTIDQDILEKLARFPRLNKDVRKVHEEILNETLDDVQYFIQSFIETYQESIDLYNSDFIDNVLHNYINPKTQLKISIHAAELICMT
ncbi:dynamin-related protein dnm1-like [Sipha flava]|uniref:Dynamin-related protein dnm1-like n=1 Tax=Sipha flava TaxID=143950 RepID=A0A8B8F361_9HEMI|nr:dynamin-related protein dnm1-like [Sipha flava]